MQEEQPQEGNSQEAGWVFKPGGGATNENHSTAENSPLSQEASNYTGAALVSWSASEYIANPKNSAWFMGLGGCTLLLSVIVYFATRDLISVVVIVILGIIVGVFAARLPHTLDYALDEGGIHLGARHYPYTAFKSFSVVQEEAFSHMSLLPLKRFMPPLSVHYPPDDEEKILTTIANYLPYEEHKRDFVESISRRARF